MFFYLLNVNMFRRRYVLLIVIETELQITPVYAGTVKLLS